jgi:gliding motility-associated protein GldC
MKTSNIRVKVELDEDKYPEKLFWEADDAPVVGLQETKAVSLSIWDQQSQDTLQISLWTKDMPVDEMERFCLGMLDALSGTLKTATGDDFIAQQLHNARKNITDYIQNKQE